MKVMEIAEFDYELEYMYFSMLKKIGSNPGMYIGDSSIEKIYCFTSGYEYALKNIKNYKLRFDDMFQKFVIKYYNCENDIHWDRLILMHNDSKVAVDVLLKLIDLFVEESNYFSQT